jgi:4-hydroxy-3-polyprenylbenzoate decarboxylase
MIWQDLRQYLSRLEELGDLRKVAGASWEEDIGGITELMTERLGPGLLFDEIPGYPRGYRVASNLYTTPRRTAVAMGLSPEPIGDLAQRWSKVIQGFRPIPPREQSSGAVLENILTGDKVDLYRFPTPRWHENDGGRYIGTGVCVIQKDPDTGFVNVGAYRVSIHDEKTCTIFIEHGKHGDRIRRKYWERGEKCPVVVSAGQEPLLTALAGPSVYLCPDGVSEYDVAGYLHQSPYPVVKGEFTALPIPAMSEIAIEGFIPSPEKALVPEGPFGEWTGYYAHGRRPETIIEVKAIYHRNGPILFGSPPMRPIASYYNPNLGGDDIDAKFKLEKAGIPGVQRVFFLARPNMRVVALKQMHPRHVDDVIRVLVPGGDQYMGHHIWVLVDDDIDVTNTAEVLWAVASRCAPESGVKVIPGTAVWQLDPRVRPEDRSNPDKSGRRTYTAHNLVINACRPYAWIGEFPPVCVNSPELRSRIQEKWKKLFTI